MASGERTRNPSDLTDETREIISEIINGVTQICFACTAVQA